MRITWLKILLFLSILFIFLFIYKKITRLREPEGFVQKEKFLVKYNKDIYDPFYVEIYDEINKTTDRIQKELSIITQLTQADYDHSHFLDIGSGTGYAVNELKELGYNTFGVDQSQAMIDYSEKKYPLSQYKCGNVEEPMLFEKGVFTHVLCLYYTIYQFKDKVSLFRNCYHWLQPGGYFILHLVEPEKFDPTKLSSNQQTILGSPKRINDERKMDSIVDFTHFQYKSSYQKRGETEIIQTESFKDKETNHIRQNEQVLYMEKIQDIISSAIYSGFTLKSKVDLKSSMMDANQYLYFFERML
jgi:SAM-dependent methyltransferase